MLQVTYYTSTFNPDCYFAAVGNVVVAEYLNGNWCDRCIYRPIRDFYVPVLWCGKPFLLDSILAPLEWAFVQVNGREFLGC